MVHHMQSYGSSMLFFNRILEMVEMNPINVLFKVIGYAMRINSPVDAMRINSPVGVVIQSAYQRRGHATS